MISHSQFIAVATERPAVRTTCLAATIHSLLNLAGCIGRSRMASAVFLVLLAATSFADDLSTAQLKQMSLAELMEVPTQIISVASRYEQKSAEAPADISVVTADEIKHFGYRTLADILRSVRGFYVSSDRLYGFTGVRGFNVPGDYGGRIMLLVNGHRMNEPLYDGIAVLSEFNIDVDLIERVEVIRGPGGSVYGNDAFFCVINVVTRQAKDLNGGEAAFSAGMNDTYTGRFSYGKSLSNEVNVLVSGSILESAGEEVLSFGQFTHSPASTAVARNMDDEHAKSTFVSVDYHGLTLEGGYVDRSKRLPTFSGDELVFQDPRYVTEDRRAFAELRFQREFGDGWQFMARTYYDYYNYFASYPTEVTDGDSTSVILNRDDDVAQWGGAEVQLGKQLGNHRLTAGMEYRNDPQLTFRNFDVNPYVLYIDQTTHRQTLSFYAQDELRICTNLLLNAGIRYDYFTTVGSEVNPRAALIYTPWKPTTLKLLFGSASRVPNASERLANSDPSSPQLGPEHTTTYELQWEQAFGPHLRSSVAGFYENVRDLLQPRINGNTETFENVDSVRVAGVETELEAQWNGGWRGRVSYAYTTTRDSRTGLVLENSPAHLAKLNLTIPIYLDKVFGGLEAQYVSARTAPNYSRADGYVAFNATLFSQKLIKNLEISGSVYNLFDTHFSDPIGVGLNTLQQPGRSFLIKLTYRF